MRRGRVVWILTYLVAVALFVAGALVYLHRHDDKTSGKPKAGALPALANVAFPVSLSVFKDKRQITQAHWLEVGVQTHAPHGVSSIELWDGAHKIDAHNPGAGSGASFQWPAINVGPHLLYATAISKDGVVATSATYPIDVEPSTIKLKSGALSVTVPVLPGEAPGDVAARLGVPPSSVTVNPEPQQGSTGLTAQVVSPTVTTTPMDGAEIAVATTPPNPSPLQLKIVPNGCDATVELAGRSGPITLAEATSGRPGFVLAGSHAAGSMTLHHLVPGVHLLTGQQGTTQSPPIEFTVPQSCAKNVGWSGSVAIVGSELTLAKPMNHGYAYVSADGGPFQRIPANPTQFLNSAGRQINIAGLMPNLSGKKLVVEQWQQNGLTAAEEGDGLWQALLDVNMVDIVGEAGTLTMEGYTVDGHPIPNLLPKGQKLVFRWNDTSDRVVGIEWQVLAAPLSPGNHDENPIGLITYGYATAGPCVKGFCDPADGPGGIFYLDTSKINVPPPTAAPGPWADLVNAIAPTANQFYVRAIALVAGDSGNVPNGDAAESIPVQVSVNEPPQPFQFHVDSVLLLPGHAPNFDLADCVDVTHTHWGPNGTVPVETSYYPADGRYCWDQFDHPTGYCDGGFFCTAGQVISDIGQGLGDLWDFVADAYNGIIDGVSSFIAQFNPVCLALSAASSSAGADCKAVAQVVAQAAISAVLVSFGLPPNLPTTSTVKAIATGDLSAIGEQLLDELGVPCDSLKLDSSESAAVSDMGSAAGVKVPTNSDGQVDACAVAVAAVVKQISAQVAQQANDAAASATGMPPCPANTCTMVPDPGGHTQPLLVNVFAHRVGGESKPEKMNIDVELQGSSPGAPSPFQGGIGSISTLPGNNDAIIAFLSFSEPTPNWNINNEEPGDVILGSFSDPGRLFGTTHLTGLPTDALGTYLAKIPR